MCILCHVSEKELQKENKANLQYNRGVEAGHLRSLISTEDLKCPSGHAKDFCSVSSVKVKISAVVESKYLTLGPSLNVDVSFQTC